MITARHQNIEQNNLLVRKGKTMIDDRCINEAIVRKLQELDRLIEYLEAQLKEAPFGTLRITHNKGKAFYYWRRDVKDICGTYMKKKDMAFICALAQKEYNTKLLHAAKEKRKAMEVFLTQNLRLFGQFRITKMRGLHWLAAGEVELTIFFRFLITIYYSVKYIINS